MKNSLKYFLILLFTFFILQSDYVYAESDQIDKISIGINMANKTYINKNGLLSLSKEDYVVIDGTYKDYYYTTTPSGNIFFIPQKNIKNIKEYQKDKIPQQIKESIDLSKNRSTLVGFAYTQIGKPYVWGGFGYDGYDCSSLMQLAYKEIGINIPRTSKDQAFFGKKIKPSDVRIGDLLFFNTLGKGISHVGMYIGEDLFIHAPNVNSVVRIDSLSNPYYSQRIVSAVSYLK